MVSAGVRHRIELTLTTRAELEQVVRDGPANLARRARIILARADGLALSAIAEQVGLHRDSVRRWLVRYEARGFAGLRHGNAGRPKNVVFDAAARAEIQRRAGIAPPMLGESYPTWSLYKLRDHLMHHGVVRTISVERLRQLLANHVEDRQYWHQPIGIGPLPANVRLQLVELLRHPQADRAQRARAILAVADGASISAVANTLHLGKGSIRRWLDYFRIAGVAGLTSPLTSARAVGAHPARSPASSPFRAELPPARSYRLDRPR